MQTTAHAQKTGHRSIDLLQRVERPDQPELNPLAIELWWKLEAPKRVRRMPARRAQSGPGRGR